jgi:hypothetical protein
MQQPLKQNSVILFFPSFLYLQIHFWMPRLRPAGSGPGPGRGPPGGPPGRPLVPYWAGPAWLSAVESAGMSGRTAPASATAPGPPEFQVPSSESLSCFRSLARQGSMRLPATRPAESVTVRRLRRGRAELASELESGGPVTVTVTARLAATSYHDSDHDHLSIWNLGTL